jgi:hypothetical protein
LYYILFRTLFHILLVYCYSITCNYHVYSLYTIHIYCPVHTLHHILFIYCPICYLYIVCIFVIGDIFIILITQCHAFGHVLIQVDGHVLILTHFHPNFRTFKFTSGKLILGFFCIGGPYSLHSSTKKICKHKMCPMVH